MTEYAYLTHKGESKLEEACGGSTRISEDVARLLERVGYDHVIVWDPAYPGARSALRQGLVEIVRSDVDTILGEMRRSNPKVGSILTTYTKLARSGSSSLSDHELNRAYDLAVGFADRRLTGIDCPRDRDFYSMSKSERAIQFDRLVGYLHRGGFNLVEADEGTGEEEAKAMVILQKLFEGEE